MTPTQARTAILVVALSDTPANVESLANDLGVMVGTLTVDEIADFQEQHELKPNDALRHWQTLSKVDLSQRAERGR